jgi:prevent-host-death family protein
LQSIHVGVREAKINLSKLLKMVQNGSEIVLTDRGRAVGKIVPIEKESLPLNARIKRLEEQGVIEIHKGKKYTKMPQPIPVPNGIAQRLLQEDREDAKR